MSRCNFIFELPALSKHLIRQPAVLFQLKQSLLLDDDGVTEANSVLEFLSRVVILACMVRQPLACGGVPPAKGRGLGQRRRSSHRHLSDRKCPSGLLKHIKEAGLQVSPCEDLRRLKREDMAPKSRARPGVCFFCTRIGYSMCGA